MKKIEIDVSEKYDVIIAENCLKDIGKLSRPLCKGNKALIVTDDIVKPLYYDIAKASLEQNGFVVYSYVIPNGEHSKNADNFVDILNKLAELHFTRTDTLFALGGGVVGDLTGFCASVYLRGISYIQVPTTLLAAVDSSVGGKTAIDLKAGKNLAGAFYQPKLVLFDINTLKTLKPETFSDGMAEVIKYGMIYDSTLFEKLKSKEINKDIISRCVEIKRDVVKDDEFDTGMRKILNFGHTIGHAIEKCSNYTMTHGTCVSIGMALITKYCDIVLHKRLCEVLKLYNLPCTCKFAAEELFNASSSDKKREGEMISLILLEDIGRCYIKDININSLKDILTETLKG